MERDIPCKHLSKGDCRANSTGITYSGPEDKKPNRQKQGHYVIIKWLVHQEDKIIIKFNVLITSCLSTLSKNS